MDDENYWLYMYKVAECPAKERHDWSKCPYAHRGERAARRCPRTYGYSADPCPEYCKRGVCLQGEACLMAHSVFESWLHPSKFRTQLCCFGKGCSRKTCFFAHNASQLRAATPSTMNPTGPVLRRTHAIVSVHQPAQEAAAAGAGVSPAVMSAATPASIPALQMQGYLRPLSQAAAMGATVVAAAPGQIPAVSNWAATGQGPAMAVGPGMGPAVAVGPMLATPPVGRQAATPGMNVSGLTASLQGLNLCHDPATILHQQTVNSIASAQAGVAMIAGQAGGDVQVFIPGLTTVSGVPPAMQMPGAGFALNTQGGAMPAGTSATGQPVVVTGVGPLQYCYLQPNVMNPQ